MGADVREGSRATDAHAHASPSSEGRASADGSTARERSCEDLQSDNARLRRELKDQHAETELILAHLEERVEALGLDEKLRHAEQRQPEPLLRRVRREEREAKYVAGEEAEKAVYAKEAALAFLEEFCQRWVMRLMRGVRPAWGWLCVPSLNASGMGPSP